MQPGDDAPDFTATTVTGESFALSSALEEQAVILYFFPKSFTPL